MNYPLPKILNVKTPEYISCPEYKDPIEAGLDFKKALMIGIAFGAAIIAAYYVAKKQKTR